MPIAARIIGGPGAGKTTRLLELMDKIMDTDVRDPRQIGFVSFTRAARREASSRAAAKFGVSVPELERDGWFRTLHSIAFKQLGIQKGELLAGTKEDNEWLKDAVNDDSIRMPSTVDDDDLLYAVPAGGNHSSMALSMWDSARSRQVALSDVWEECDDLDDRTPPYSLCSEVVTLYEDAKKMHGRCDFTDTLMRFAGRMWTGLHEEPFTDTPPDGSIPYVPVYFWDEAQDCSALTAMVMQRLVSVSTWLYLVGDPDQCIYSWSGARPKYFMDWTIAAGKQSPLPKSYRCAKNILDVGSNLIRLNSDHFVRDFAPAREGGDVVRGMEIEEALDSIDPDEDTLVLARTREYAKNIAELLNDSGVPWKPTKGNGGFNAPALTAGVAALMKLARGESVDGEAMGRVMDLIPARLDGVQMVVRGMKKWYDSEENRKNMLPVTLKEIDLAGCTEGFKELVSSGRYRDVDPDIARIANAASASSIERVVNPMVRVGTCHSAKGMEASHVVVLNQIPWPTQKAIEGDEGMQEERRVWYVSVTRAKNKLTIAEGEGEPFPDL